jgi:hypothetical protein
MRSLPKPTDDVRSVLDLCANNVRKRDFSTRLHSVSDIIEAAENDYEVKGENGSLFTIAEAESVAGIVTKKEMENLYTGTFSRQRSKVRPIYDKIKSAPRNGICPLCSQRVVTQLDHYLPKTRHPALAVTPINLVPSCSDCNKEKLALQPTTSSEQTLHPYFDEVDDEIWLSARVVENSPPAIVFSATPPNTWSTVKYDRVRYHFETLCLGSLYSSNAGAELINIRFSLMRVAERGGTENLKTHLAEQVEDRQTAERNSWQAAMYDALRKSNWFCEVGYKCIA